MSSIMGDKIKVSIFGQSHSEAIGCVIDGLPAGIKPDMENILKFMARRAPGNSNLSTSRKEADLPRIISGIVNGVTCGSPLCAVIENTNTRSQDYENLKLLPRPSHSDYPYYIKTNGTNDIRGGGHSSGRLTAPICFAGAIAIQILKDSGINIMSHIYSIHNQKDTPFDLVNLCDCNPSEKSFPVISDDAGEKMKKIIEAAAENKNSVGGIIECAVTGVPTGTGNPMFAGIENKLSANIFGIPAVKGIEFGRGFSLTEMFGSESNDDFYIDKNDEIKTVTNNQGGILGGMASGMPIVFRIAVKPTPSIGLEQQTVNLKTRKSEKLIIEGRHDPCIVLRAVPVVEAVTALTMLDMIM